MVAQRTASVSAYERGGVNARKPHVRGVARCAVGLARALGFEGGHLEEAALWHDVGYSGALKRTGLHSLDGARHLASRGVPRLVVSLVAYHSGAEYEAEERGLVVDLADFERPPEHLLDALILADMTVGPAGQTVTVDQRIAEILIRYAPNHPVHRAVTRSQGYLRECAERAARATGSPEEWGFSAA